MRGGSRRGRLSRPLRRRSKRGEPSKVSKYVRHVSTAVTVCAILAGAWMFVAKAAEPYLISYGESKEIAEIKHQIAAAEGENKTLKRDLKYLSTPRGMEAEARKLGWVKEGEIALVIEQPEGSAGNQGQPAEPLMRESFWQAAARRITRFFARTNGSN